MAGHIDTTDLLMVGKTGVGKSALGNSILQKKAFTSKNSTESVTKTADFDYCEFDGRKIKVVDGPGLGDTALNPEEAVRLVADAMSKAICANPKGYHAILLVVRYGGRFTKEDTETVATLKKIFGEKFISDHAILVMTCGDSFKHDAEESGQTFEEWCAEQGGIFGQLYTEVKKRATLFDNTTKEKHFVYDQIQRLLGVVDDLGARYTTEMFEEAKSSTNRLSLSQRLFINEEAIREVGLITQGLSRVDYKKPAEGLHQLQDLKKRADRLFEDVMEQDQGTNSLSVAMKMAKSLKEATAEHLEEMQKVFDETHPKETDQGGRPEAESLTEDGCQSVMMRRAQQVQSDERGRPERKSVKIRRAEIENLQSEATAEKLGSLQREKQRSMRQKQEAEEREMQTAENKRRCEEEQRAYERARKEEQMDKKKQQEIEQLAEENEKSLESLGMSLEQSAVQKEKVLQEELARLEEDYQELKGKSRSSWMKGAPAVFSKILSAIGVGGKSRQK